jgi:hypothetical protein
MALALIIIGMVLGMAAINGTIADNPKTGAPGLGTQINRDLFGQNGQGGFLEWLLAIAVIAAIFKMVDLPGAGKLFVALVIVAYVIKNIDSLVGLPQAIQSLHAPGASSAAPAQGTSSNSGSSGGIGNIFNIFPNLFGHGIGGK